MKKPLIVLLPFVFVGCTPPSGTTPACPASKAPAELPPPKRVRTEPVQYLPSALDAARRTALETQLPQRLAAATLRLADERRQVSKTFRDAPDTSPRDRVEKRLLMAERLAAFIGREISFGDTTGLCRAEEALDELDELLRYFALERAAWATNPLNPSVQAHRLNVKDFGAKGDGQTDDAPAFERAFAAVRARKGAPCVLEVPAGEYLLVGTNPDFKPHLDSGAISNCVIAGASQETAKLVLGRYDGDGIRFTRAYNSTLQDVQLHWKETPFVEGTVEEVSKEGGWIVVKHRPGTLKPNDPRFSRIGHPNSCVQFSADRRPIRKPVLWYDYRCDDLGGGRYRMHFAPEYASTRKMDVDLGATFVYPDRNNALQALRCPGSTLFTYSRVWVRNSRAGAFSSGPCRYPSVIGCRISPLKGDYSLSTNADGGFSPSGVYLANCDFTNMNDDGVNSHNKGATVFAKVDDRTIEHDPFWEREWPGLLAVFVRSMDGMFLGQVRVASCRNERRDGGVVGVTTFDRPLPAGLKAWEDMPFPKYSALDIRAIRLGTKKTPDYPDQFYLPMNLGTGFVCTGNRFTNLRGVAIQIQCANAYVADNVIDSVYRGIEISNLLHYQEGPAPYNLVIRGNAIRRVNRGIRSSAMTVNHPPAKSVPFADVLIEGNALSEVAERAFIFNNMDAPTVRDNTLDGRPLDGPKADAPLKPAGLYGPVRLAADTEKE